MEATLTDTLRAIRHANGFTIYKLAERLRLHVWDGETPFGDVHSHRWDLESRVLVGELLVRDYREIPGDGLARFEYGDDDDLTAAGRGEVELTGERIIRAGEIHVCQVGELHAVAALAPTVTVFRHGPSRATPIVYDPASLKGPE